MMKLLRIIIDLFCPKCGAEWKVESTKPHNCPRCEQ